MEIQKEITDPDEVVERMSLIKSSGIRRGVELHEDVKKLVDWKAYVQARLLMSVAIVSLVGFGVFRKAVGT